VTGSVVVVGASVAGVRTVQALREQGYAGRIQLVGAEPDPPYDKPPLSKQFLAGSWPEDRIALLSDGEAVALGVELRLGIPADHLDVAGRSVVLADGDRLPYDAVVLATGASARPSPWAVASGVSVLRTVADSRRLRRDLAAGGPVVVVGGGFIGAEVAATARAAGHEVTVVDPLTAPLGRVLGREVGELFAGVHGRHGVATRFGAGVQEITGEAGALRVALTDGEVLPAVTVVVGIGVVPNDAWLASSGLLVDNGVVCDTHCRAVDSPDVYAAGDLVRWYHSGHGELVRAEHWTNAVEQASFVAAALVHPAGPAYTPVDYVWSDQYDWRIQIVGRPQQSSGHRLLGDPDGAPPRFAVLYGDETGRLTGAAAVNWPKALSACRRLLARGGSLDEACRQVADATGATRSPGSVFAPQSTTATRSPGSGR